MCLHAKESTLLRLDSGFSHVVVALLFWIHLFVPYLSRPDLDELKVRREVTVKAGQQQFSPNAWRSVYMCTKNPRIQCLPFLLLAI